MLTKKVSVIAGSLRSESYSKKIAKLLTEIAPRPLELQILKIENLSFYNQDLDETPPLAWTEFRNQIRSSDAIIFVTPEYNRSIPGVLKNALDIASRPYGQNAFEKKAAGVISISIGALGGFGANHHLRQILVPLNMPTMPQPEVYLGEAKKYFSDSGSFISEPTRGLLIKFLSSFSDWIERSKVQILS